MKILRLFFQNLNSLRGRFEIDFERPPLSESGLFAITGPTGAGKSTVLDAITLALYGRSARYGTVPNPTEVMSRHSAECAAEVDFVCATGRYRSVWKLRRAKGAVDGNVIKERRVVRLPDEEILTQKQDDSNRLITELTGLDYDRLLRSVLLAQGEFAAFLRAKPAQRTELLERVTGAAVYSQISIAAYEEAKKAGDAHQKLADRLGEIAVLPEELRAAKQTRLQEIDAEWNNQRQLSEALRANVTAAKQYGDYQTKLGETESSRAALIEQQSRHAAEFAALERHEQAAQWGPKLAELDLLQDQWRRGIKELERVSRSLPALTSAAADTECWAQMARGFTAQCERGAAQFQARFDEVTGIDQELAQTDKTLAAHREHIRQVTARVQGADTKLNEAKGQAAKWQEKLETADAWLNARLIDKGLAEAWPDLWAQAQEWLGHSKQQKAALDEADEWRIAGERHKAQLAILEPDVEKLREAMSAAEATAQVKQAESEKVLDGKTEEQWEEERTRAEAAGAALQSLQSIADKYCALTTRLSQLQNESRETEKRVDETQEQVQRATQVRDAAAALVEAKRRVRELALRVQSFEQHRHLLAPGEACPLCGSLEHPFAASHGQPSDEVATAERELKEADKAWKSAERASQDASKAQTAYDTTLARLVTDTQRVTQEREQCEGQWSKASAAANFSGPPEDVALLDDALRQAQAWSGAVQERLRIIRRAKEASQKAATLFQEAHVKWMGECAKKENAEGELRNCRLAWQQAQKRAQSARDLAAQTMESLSGKLAAYGETPLAHEGDAITLQRRIQERIKAHERKTQERSTAQQELATLTQKQEGLLQQRLTANEDLKTAQEREQSLVEHQTALHAQRREKFGDKIVSKERARLLDILRTTRQERDDAQRMTHEAIRRRDAAQQLQDSLSQQTRAHQSSIEQSEVTLLSGAQQAGFASLEALRQSLLPASEAERRATLRSNFQSQEQSLTAQRETFEKLLAALPMDAAESAARLAELETQQQAAEAGLQELGHERGALGEELRQDGERRQGVVTLTLEITQADAERLRWKNLSDLIGSANGGAFSRFAQGLTLERLVGLANRHLHHLNPRYSLRRAPDDAEDLELEVVDHYQADVCRPMASLSGGESFLASLALALGLSDLASGRKAIESLFIDEGFGTLDAETLDSAMAALERLQATGKTIGLISHVESMKERISTQIQITKGVGGWSDLKVV